MTSYLIVLACIPAWILKMAEDERCYEEAKKQALTELERCRTHVLREFEQRRKQCEDAYRAEMDVMRQKLDKRLKEYEQVQTDMALNKFRRLSMDHSIRSREEREKKMREMNESSKQVFNKERKRFSIG
uniref:Meiosis-specific nuclear structural protein 1 n=1 Tax=Angiostrongylus cantonensis TaxID=6313 RepID=A0A0K0D782_ANGCA